MKFLTDRISELKIGWNERPLTEADFYRLCRRFRIKVTEMPLRVGGFHYRLLGRDFIAVDSRLGHVQKLAVMFHELGHFLLHAPESRATANFHHIGCQTRQEHEADVFAYCCLVPKRWIVECSANAILEQEEIPSDILKMRYEFYQRHGI